MNKNSEPFPRERSSSSKRGGAAVAVGITKKKPRVGFFCFCSFIFNEKGTTKNFCLSFLLFRSLSPFSLGKAESRFFFFACYKLQLAGRDAHLSPSLSTKYKKSWRNSLAVSLSLSHSLRASQCKKKGVEERFRACLHKGRSKSRSSSMIYNRFWCVFL